MLELLEAADVARMLDRTPARVRQLVGAGLLLPAVITPRGVRLFARDEVERLLRERRQSPRRGARQA